MAIIELALKLRRPGQLVIAGVEGHNLELVVADGLAAKQAGADALLVFPPFDRRAYRRLATNSASVRFFFEALDRRVGLPMVIFQYPPSTGCAYSVEALRTIVDLPNVVAIKMATAGDFDAYVEVWDALKNEVSILVGVDSPPLLDMLNYGAHGALIGISAVATPEWSRLLELVARGDAKDAEALFDRVCRPLMRSLFEDQRPVRLTSEAAAMKEALFQLGEIASSAVRAPAIVPDEAVRHEIRESLQNAGLHSKIPA